MLVTIIEQHLGDLSFDSAITDFPKKELSQAEKHYNDALEKLNCSEWENSISYLGEADCNSILHGKTTIETNYGACNTSAPYVLNQPDTMDLTWEKSNATMEGKKCMQHNESWRRSSTIQVASLHADAVFISSTEEAKVTQLSRPATMKVFEISNGTTLSLALFTDVTNSKELLEFMQAGTLEPEVAFLNASLIPDVFPLLAAAHKTLVSKSRESLTTRTLHSELVYNYSGSKHITESLKRCGISDSSTYVLAARFNASPDEMKAVEKLINGKEIDLEELEGRADKAHIQKHYKITALELGISSLADAITCRIAARDAL
ncbi:hypothetical protein QYF36_025437 [Acer negundo]|nr:hypothetical protein QYF36_025437 [Acer negundo]